MSVVVTGVVACRRELQEIEDFLNSRKPMEGIVMDIKTEILVKTALGKDYRGRGFAAYSKAYAKKKAGMTATGRPNLKVTGAMLGAMKAEVLSPGHGRVSIAQESDGPIGTDMLAQIHNTGTGKQPTREFMNITENAVRVLVKKHYDDPIGEIVRKHR